MVQQVIPTDVHVAGTLGCDNLNPPDASIDNDAITGSGTGAVSAAKLQAQHALGYAQADGADVASETKALHVARAAGTIVAVEAQVQTAPTGGGDKQFTVDIQKSVGGGAYATILSSVITFADGDSDREVKTGTLATTTFADGDSLRAVITASGSTGSQGQGVVVTTTIREWPDPAA